MDPHAFEREIFRWYRERGRHTLPWRRTENPYRVLVSEIMLQQTQVDRVIPYYRAWLRAFPNWRALARAPFSRVLALWSGLGYNRRAKYLWETAKIVDRDFRGRLPLDPRLLETLPGIGPYTARAVCCFAHGPCEPFLETNIRRVLLHFFFPRLKNVSDAKLLAVLQTLSRHRSIALSLRDFYLALMDYGANAMKGVPNPNRRSRHYGKQSRFEGSRRYFRGQILRLMLARHGAILWSELVRNIRPELTPETVEKIVRTLQKDGLVDCPEHLTSRAKCVIVRPR